MQIADRISFEMQIRDKVKHVTFGFVRNEIDAVHVSIPDAIKHLICSYVPSLWIDSVILTHREQQCLLDMIATHEITAKFAGCEWKLIFRASRDGYSSKQFHAKCDGKANTVCFVETEFDHVCGGYVEVEWKDGSDGQWAAPCSHAYMFVVRPTQQIFEQVRKSASEHKESAVAHFHGDSFNFGYNDLYLVDDRGYCSPHGHYGFASREQVAGARSFRYTDYEVFQLVL
mmetsp:Transcript_42037/g.67578  ORF Transcript_42037/g.67578 Transcript_42037/m.67578 type:complete len:229 (+) Transcript_42037:116-802(+)